MVEFYDWERDKSRVESIFGGSPTEMPRAYELGSPIFHVRPGVAPFLLIGDAIDFGGIEGGLPGLHRIAPSDHDIGFIAFGNVVHLVVNAGQFGELQAGLRCLCVSLGGKQGTDKALRGHGAKGGAGAFQKAAAGAVGNDVAHWFVGGAAVQIFRGLVHDWRFLWLCSLRIAEVARASCRCRASGSKVGRLLR